MMLTLALMLSTAQAQDATTDAADLPQLAATTWRPAVDGRHAFAVGDAAVQEGFIGQADMQLLADPLRYIGSQGQVTELLAWVWQLDLAAAWGVGPVQVAADMPMVLLYQGDDDIGGATLGDPRLHAKLAPLPPGMVGLALLGGVSAPLGAADDALGEPGWAGNIGLRLDLSPGPVWTGVEASTLIRPTSDAPGLVQDDALLLRGAVALDLSDDARIALEITTQTALATPFDAAASTPTELIASSHFGGKRGIRFRAGGGVGIGGGVGEPTWRLVLGLGHAGGGPDPAGDGG